MPFALDGSRGESVIESRGIAHRVVFTIDPVRRTPKIEHTQRRSVVQIGTRFTLRWPVSATERPEAKAEIVQIVRDFAWLNPHASFTVNGKDVANATNPAWRKWSPRDPAPAAWYYAESFGRLIGACVARDEDHGRERMVREFIADFRGFARSDVQKQALDAVGAARMPLREFFGQPARVKKLLAVMQAITKPVPAKDLGLLGREHFEIRFNEAGADPDTFQYRRTLLDIGGVPYAIEAAFGYCPDDETHRQIVGVNWSLSLINPLRDLNTVISLDSLLADQRAGEDEPIILALHLASPCIAYTDKAKSALVLPDQVADALVEVARDVTKAWAKVRKAEERYTSRRERRQDLLVRSRKESQTAVADEIMAEAYRKVSDDGHGGTLPANVRQLMYACRNEIQERSGRELGDSYFTQSLLPNFMAKHEELTAGWDVVFDDRGHLTEPHTGQVIGLGTLAVRGYLEGMSDFKVQPTTLTPARIDTRGPHRAFGALLYIEKEGFDPLLEKVQLAERFDLAIMSSKGMSVVAARALVDEVCHTYRIPLFVLHDFDKAGFSIRAGFMHRESRRYTFKNKIKVIDLGLRLGDIEGLQSENVFDKGSDAMRAANLRKNGATPQEIEFLLHRRVELNAMTSRQLVAFIESKLTANGLRKIVPTNTELAEAYRGFAHGRKAEAIIKRELAKLNGVTAPVPRDLKARVEDYLRRHPTVRWDEAVSEIVNGGAS